MDKVPPNRLQCQRQLAARTIKVVIIVPEATESER
jgi:hypothetical protein